MYTYNNRVEIFNGFSKHFPEKAKVHLSQKTIFGIARFRFKFFKIRGRFKERYLSPLNVRLAVGNVWEEQALMGRPKLSITRANALLFNVDAITGYKS